MSAIVTTSAAGTIATPEDRDDRIKAGRRTRRRAQVLTQLAAGDAAGEDAGLLARHQEEMIATLRPSGAWQHWVAGEVATLMVRISRTARVECRLRDWAAYRAIDFWEEDQALAVATLALRLEKDPARTVARLRQTPAGCDWLLKRWRALGAVAPAAWTAEQAELAARLLGGDAAVDPAAPGFVAERVAELTTYRGRVEEADAILRGLVEADLSDAGVPGLAGLRRYARSLQRRLTWCLDNFHLVPAGAPAAASPSIPTTPTTAPKSIASEQESANRETNPISSAQKPPPGETNPIKELIAEFRTMEATTARDFPMPRRPDNPPRRHADPAHEAARRQQLARREASLACMAGA